MNVIFLLISVLGFSARAEVSTPTTAKRCYNMSTVACEVFHLTNIERKKNRRPALQYCERCFAMAQEQSEDMYSRSYFSHTRPSTTAKRGESFSQRAQRFGLGWSGENIAQTNGGSAQAVKMWMNSPGHRRNILNQDYTSFAVGYRNGLYTQVFAKNPGSSAPQPLDAEELPAEDDAGE